LLTQSPKWTIGFLANNIWSVAGGKSRPPVNQFALQYFVDYNPKKGMVLNLVARHSFVLAVAAS
jgi:hypothetical protein